MNPSKEVIRKLIPHKYAMCLVDAVVRWDAESIVCATAGHRSPNHPLRAAGCLPALAGIEYAAQAMAIHAALAAEAGARGSLPGVLAGVRETSLHVARLDDIEDELRIEARLLIQQRYNLLYSFRVSDKKKVLVEGRAAIALGARTKA